MFQNLMDNKCLLRPLHANDTNNLFNLINNSRTHLRQWLEWIDLIQSTEDVHNFIRLAQHEYIGQRGLSAGIWCAGQLSGIIGLYKLDLLNKSTSIGYWLGKQYEGKGLMTRACKMLLDHLFYQSKLNRVDMDVAVNNHRSRSIPERFGFSIEGNKRQCQFLHGQYIDHIMYAMLAQDWKNKINKTTGFFV